MLLDKNLMLSDQQSLVGSAGAVLSEKSIDMRRVATAATDALGNTPVGDLGRGIPIELLIQVTQDFDSSGDNTTCKAELIMADDEALSSNVVVLASSAVIAQAVLVAGYQFRVASTLPIGLTSRHLGARYTTATGDPTAGKITAGITMGRQSNPA